MVRTSRSSLLCCRVLSMKRAFCPQSCRLLRCGRHRPACDGRSAAERDKKFFQSVEGNWVGPGEIVAGKYKGTKFNCTSTARRPTKKAGMTLDGGCRVGVFKQKMTATVEQQGRRLQGQVPGRRRRQGPRHHLRQRRRRPQGRLRHQPQPAQRHHAGPPARRQHDERHRFGAGREADGAGDRHEPEARRRRRSRLHRRRTEDR